jgi:hypothetical protein
MTKQQNRLNMEITDIQQILPIEQCIDLKAKGFNVPVLSFYSTHNNSLHSWAIGKRNYHYIDLFQNHNSFVDRVSAPEFWQIVEWASLSHNIEIEARPVIFAGDLKASYYQPYINGCVANLKKFATRKDALLEAIKNFIKNNL